jgi:hypothetical protein
MTTKKRSVTWKRSVTCREAIQQVFADGDGVLTVDQVIERVCAQYPDKPWKNSSIQAHLTGLVINPPESNGAPGSAQHVLLYSLGDGRYRRWRPDQEASPVAACPGAQVSESQGQPEDCQQTASLRPGSSETEAILAHLERISRQLSAEDSVAMSSSRRKKDFGLFVAYIAVALLVTFAALLDDVQVEVLVALGFFFLCGAMSFASGALAEAALSHSAELVDKINNIGGSSFLLDKRWRMQWEVSGSSSQLRVSLVSGALIYLSLALTAIFLVLAFVSK